MKKVFKKIIIVILTFEAGIVLWRFKPKVIAVTGNVGKTSTKDAIYTIFSKLSSTQKSEKSFNSEIGVPLAVLGLKNAWNNPILWLIAITKGLFTSIFRLKYPEWLILEIGADRPCDIKNITRWVKPDIAVINKIGSTPVHVEFFSSPEELAKEKSYLAKAVKQNGALVAYIDDEKTAEIADKHKPRNVITFGTSDKADIYVSNYTILYKKTGESLMPSGISFKINAKGNCLPVMIEGALGFQHVYPTLAAIATAMIAKLNIISAVESLREHKTPPGRMRLIEGLKESVVIDDSYNSSPSALKEALVTLKAINVSGKKIAVLGDMLELGKYSREAHLEIGKIASKSSDILCVVGELGKIIAEGALNAGMPENKIYSFENSKKAGDEIQNMIGKNDVILVKGSQGVRMERVVEEIMNEPEKAKELLVRQEKEWEGR